MLLFLFFFFFVFVFALSLSWHRSKPGNSVWQPVIFILFFFCCSSISTSTSLISFADAPAMSIRIRQRSDMQTDSSGTQYNGYEWNQSNTGNDMTARNSHASFFPFFCLNNDNECGNVTTIKKCTASAWYRISFKPKAWLWNNKLKDVQTIHRELVSMYRLVFLGACFCVDDSEMMKIERFCFDDRGANSRPQSSSSFFFHNVCKFFCLANFRLHYCSINHSSVINFTLKFSPNHMLRVWKHTRMTNKNVRQTNIAQSNFRCFSPHTLAKSKFIFITFDMCERYHSFFFCCAGNLIINSLHLPLNMP